MKNSTKMILQKFIENSRLKISSRGSLKNLINSKVRSAYNPPVSVFWTGIKVGEFFVGG